MSEHDIKPLGSYDEYNVKLSFNMSKDLSIPRS